MADFDFSGWSTEIASLETDRASDLRTFLKSSAVGVRPHVAGVGVTRARALTALLTQPVGNPESQQDFATRMDLFRRASALSAG